MIYWLINHCTDGVSSFGRLFDFQDVIYHVHSCTLENRRSYFVLTTNGRSNAREIRVSTQTRVTGNPNALFRVGGGGIVIYPEGCVLFLIDLCVIIKINSHWQCCLFVCFVLNDASTLVGH